MLLFFNCLPAVTVSVMCLYTMVSWVGLQCVIVVLPSHTHFLVISSILSAVLLSTTRQHLEHNHLRSNILYST